MYDGEGTFKKNMNDPSGSVVITQTMHNPDLLAELRTVLDRLGFSFSEAWHSPGGGWSDRCNFTINGGWGERYRFLAQIAPVRALPIEQSLYAALETKVIGLDTCDSSGVADVYWLETETGNYIAEGLCSQNSFADTYQQLIKRGLLTVRLHAATDNGLITGNPVFLSKEAWRIECTKPSNVVASQMLQNPAAGNEAMFKEEWLKGKFLHIRPSTLTVAIMCDPASSKKKGSDDTVMHVWGMDAARNRYLLDGYHHKMSLSERWTHLRDLHKVWSQMPGVQFCKVGYERFGSTADLEYFTERMEMEKYHFDITELSWPRESEEKSKYDRIQRLEPDFRLGKCFFAKKLPDGVSVTKEQQEVIAAGQNWRVWLPTRRRDHEGHAYGIQPKLFAEYLLYPFSPHDDGLDTASRWSDMDMRPPVIIDERQLEPEVFSDGA
jgi:hypothetical protein